MYSQVNLINQSKENSIERQRKPQNQFPPTYSNNNILSRSQTGSNYLHSLDSRILDRSRTPQKTEWALLNQQRARQYEQTKTLQKQMARQKKQKFKQQLDKQLFSRNTSKMRQEQEDRKYYNYLIQKQEQQKKKDRQQKINKSLQYKRYQQLNERKIHQKQEKNHHRRASIDTGLNIGMLSQMDLHSRKQVSKRNLVDALDKQMHMKQSQRKLQKMQQMQKIQENQRYQQLLDHRNRQSRNYQQNPNIYEYYKRLNYERKMKDKQLQHRLVDQAQNKKLQKQKKLEQNKRHQISRKNNEIKSILDDQIKFNQYRKQLQRKINPQDHSYSYIGNIFRDKQSKYNKKQYFEDLQRQASEQKHHRHSLDYMSEQQYRYNFNQLHKAVKGDYAFDKYVDRSVNAIGLDTKNKHKNANKSFSGENFNEHDTEIVKMKIQEIKVQEQQRKQLLEKQNSY